MSIRTEDDPWVVGLATDCDGQCLSIDETWTELTGQPVNRALGRGWFDALHPDDRADALEKFRAALKQQTAFRYEFRVRWRDGVYRWALAVGAPRFDDMKIVGYAGSIINIHAIRVARQRVEEDEEKLRLALDAAEMGTFVWRIDDGRCECDLRMFGLFGLPSDGRLSLNSALDHNIHPEDRSRFADALARALDPSGDGRLREDVRIRWPDGALRWLQISAQVYFGDEPRRSLRIVGAAMDITAREQAKEALAVVHERLTATLKASPVVAVEQDGDLRYIWMQNPALGYSADRVVGKTDRDLFEREEDAKAVAAIKQRVLDTGSPVREEVCILSERGLRWYDLIVEPRRAGQEIIGLLCVATDITEHKHVEAALVEANRRTRDFLAVLGHELRNPLAFIQHGVQLLKSTEGFPEQQQTLDAMARQAVHLARLADDLLDMSRINHGNIDVRREPLDLGRALKDAVDSMRPRVEEKRHRLEVSLTAEPLTVVGDETRISQIVANLVGNAIKYTDPGGLIRINLERQNGNAVLTVTDSGIGISPDILPRVFDLFMQADRTRETGLGVGLALSRTLVELHGGVIEVQSPGLGQGSTFIVRLPLGAPLSAAADRRPPAVVPGHGLKVLVIDDNHDVTDSFVMLLKTFDVTAEAAYSGEEGLEIARTFRPDIAFIDIRMPGIDGYETARRIRALPSDHKPMLVALSGTGLDKDTELSAYGFDFHLVKPIGADAIAEVIAQRVAAHPPTREV
jgi:PAS domain S-box-containing protein